MWPTAFAARQAPSLLSIEANWKSPEYDEANVAWVRDCFADMQAVSDGSEYLNFPGFLEDGDDTFRTAFGPNYDRLAEIKAMYDPTNFFHLNQNIVAAG